MVPVEPLPALDHFVAAAASKTARTHASFTLPFGLRGEVNSALPGGTAPDVGYVQPDFAALALAGGRQLSMRAPGYPATVGMSGFARTTSDASTSSSIDPNDYGASVLGSSPGEIAGFFLDDFGPPPRGASTSPRNNSSSRLTSTSRRPR
jgi:hypothetical protein